MREPAAPFDTTSRWLRGRLLDLLRDAPDGTWATIPTVMGRQDADAIEVALTALAREGLAERHPAEPGRARLPVA